MKVTIHLVVEVDAEQWALEYDILKEDVREDVKSYVRYWCEGTPVPLKVIKSNEKPRMLNTAPTA